MYLLSLLFVVFFHCFNLLLYCYFLIICWLLVTVSVQHLSSVLLHRRQTLRGLLTLSRGSRTLVRMSKLSIIIIRICKTIYILAHRSVPDLFKHRRRTNVIMHISGPYYNFLLITSCFFLYPLFCPLSCHLWDNLFRYYFGVTETLDSLLSFVITEDFLDLGRHLLPNLFLKRKVKLREKLNRDFRDNQEDLLKVLLQSN